MSTLFNLGLEQSVLVGLMAHNSAYDLISDMVSGDDFYSPHHRVIWSVLVERLISKGLPADSLIVADQLTSGGIIEHAGGMGYFVEMMRSTSDSTANIESYAKRIREFSVRRRLLAAAEGIREAAEGGMGTSDLLIEAERQVLSVSDSGGLSDRLPSHDTRSVIESMIDQIERASNRKPGELSGTPTGLRDLDSITDGLQAGDMVVIGARPSMGKTTLAMNLVEAALMADDGCVVVFSMEQPMQQLSLRLMAQMTGIDYGRMQRGQVEPDEWPKISAVSSKLRDRKLEICDRGGLSPTEIGAFLRRAHRKHGKISLIMTDYLQKMRIANHRGNTNEMFTECSAMAKEFAKTYRCPHVVLSQLSKECDRRPNKRPVNADLRECGAIEQDADVVLMLYRDEVYNIDSKDKGTAEIIITKSRNGQTGTVRASFNGATFRFGNLVHGWSDRD